MPVLLLLPMTVTLAVCSDSASDETTDDGFGGTGDLLTPPEPPDFTPCPEGWREVAPEVEGGITTCDPWPASGRAECGDDETHFPGDPACDPIGTACPSGTWAEDLPADRPVLYVQAEADDSGSGTTEAPFGRIADALDEATSDTVIALSAGRYDEIVVLPDGVALWGACVAGTEIVAPPNQPVEGTPFVDPSGSVQVVGHNAAIHNLRVGGDRGGIWVGEGASVELAGVLVDGATPFGLSVVGGQVDGSELVVRRSGASPDGEVQGGGMGIQKAARVDLERVVLEHNRLISAVVGVGAHVSLRDLALVETEVVGGAFGLVTDVDAEVTLDRAAVMQSQGVALFLTDTETLPPDRGDELPPPEVALRLHDVVFAGPEPTSDPLFAGLGLAVNVGRASLDRTVFDGLVGVSMWGETDASLVLSDVLVRNGRSGVTATERRCTDNAGGLWLSWNSSAALERVALQDNEGVAIVASVDSTIWGQDVEVAGTREISCVDDSEMAFKQSTEPQPAEPPDTDPVEADASEAPPPSESVGGTFGMGVAVLYGATLELRRFRIAESILVGIQLANEGAADLHEGEIARNLIGVNLQTAAFDLDRLADQVFFVDNERNLDVETLPVPELEEQPLF